MMIRIQYLIVVLAAFMMVHTPTVLGSPALEVADKASQIEVSDSEKRLLGKCAPNDREEVHPLLSSPAWL